jgi:hypothetical protein
MGAGVLYAQDADRFTLKLAVIGPGDELYFWWGHIALVIEDGATGESTFYDWGIFSFENENFFKNFAFGRLIYRCGASPAKYNFARYIETNRDIILYTLNLSPEEKEMVRDFANNNIRPENRDYYYHHFKDNCSTRVRDILDMVTGGQFKAEFGDAPGRYTLRQHVRRHTYFSPFFDWFLNFLMGQDIDTPLTVWQEMFLPAEVGNRVADFSFFSYMDKAGERKKLVTSVEILNSAVNRPPVLEVPRRQWDRELIAGVSLALMLVVFALTRTKKPILGRYLWGLSQSVLGLFFGGTGLVLFFMTFFTNHDYTYHNANVIFINPLLLAAVPLGIFYAISKDEKKRFFLEQSLRALWTYVFLGGILTMAIKLSPSFYQQNQVTQALTLPFAFVLSFGGGFFLSLFRKLRKIKK